MPGTESSVYKGGGGTQDICRIWQEDTFHMNFGVTRIGLTSSDTLRTAVVI